MNKKILITTPLYYASGNLHIGHLFSTNLAWVLRNLKRIQGYDAKLLSGIDEHGSKIQQKAKEEEYQPQDFVNYINNKFLHLWDAYKIDIDFYERTTNVHHINIVANIFEKMLKQGDIEFKNYTSWYSTSDEEFVTLTNAIQKEDGYYHPVSYNKLIKLDENNYFFLMKKYQKWLESFLNNNVKIYPIKVLNEITNNFLNEGLEDLSVTRENVEWGIKTLSNKSQTIYVWLDALFGYLTGLNYKSDNDNNFSDYWKNSYKRIQVMGKEISRFHLIYWPIFLQSLNLTLPTDFLVHGWLLSKGMKMSKSIGNVIDPYQLLKKYDPEMIKYYFVAKIDPKNDGNVDDELIMNTVNSELINNYGNLISRTLKMKSNSFTAPVKYSTPTTEQEIEIENKLKEFSIHADKFIEEYRINELFEFIIRFSSELNLYIENTKPWTLKEDLPRLEKILNLLLNGIYAISCYLKAVMPNKIKELEQALGIKFNAKNIANFNKFDNINPVSSFMLWNRIK
ncbi:methionine--tRNA ligase [Mycoplasma phocimorsus]|uniref:Methionine--tRNA ligase n=1 Tax=Mycoplasma phocimorsus TaxID=3045839 RepID=A0AAJ1PRG6_9MOLU|nr:methionine--tRNA ligase [Mycoplasma phocimorsus]MDJ1645496.1 methionine--tRNA ligase [Mycoplasma phocimorsus]MDJ1646455.1 methionine--tRNA ligase [Mycoplasma phocimorsus]MDJ1646981.1 methionine--tRNA ligase [Mycoplasma phocimorsus]MDJ1647427.1 methionine--tRNA ligase [Mycoplasma phocimorsus]MDJ1647939.1 methionine--tRNA ligase [Mycoplasma phocimorsus]